MATKDIPVEEESMATSLKTRGTELVVTETVLVLGVFIVAIIGNTMVLTAICRNARLRRGPYVPFIVSFGAADILMIFLVALLSVASVVTGQWVFSDAVCQFQGLVLAFLVEVTVFTMFLAAADRCFNLIRPINYNKVITRKITSVFIVSAWMVSMVIPGAFRLNGHKFVFHPGNVLCRPDMRIIDYRFAVAAEIVFVVFPLAVIAGCYIEIKRRMEANLLRSNKTKERNSETVAAWEKDERITRLFGATTAGVLVCWTPFLLVDIMDSFTTQSLIPRSIYFVSSLLALTSCAVKPFVYCIMSKELKAEISKFRKCKRVTDLTQGETSRTNKYLRPKTASSIPNYEIPFEEVKENSLESEPATERTSCHSKTRLASATRQITVTPFEDTNHFEDESENLHTSSRHIVKGQSEPLESPNTEHVLATGAHETSYDSPSSSPVVDNNLPALDPATEFCRIEVEPAYERKTVLPPIVQHRLTERIFNTLTPVTGGERINESFV